MAHRFSDVAKFYVVYIREAHPADGKWAMPVDKEGTLIASPKTLAERTSIAKTCCTKLKIDMPCLIDDMDNTTARAYGAAPDRLFVIGKDGRIAVRGGRGPFGFKPKVVRDWLEKQFPEVAAADGEGAGGEGR